MADADALLIRKLIVAALEGGDAHTDLRKPVLHHVRDATRTLATLGLNPGLTEMDTTPLHKIGSYLRVIADIYWSCVWRDDGASRYRMAHSYTRESRWHTTSNAPGPDAKNAYAAVGALNTAGFAASSSLVSKPARNARSSAPRPIMNG